MAVRLRFGLVGPLGCVRSDMVVPQRPRFPTTAAVWDRLASELSSAAMVGLGLCSLEGVVVVVWLGRSGCGALHELDSCECGS